MQKRDVIHIRDPIHGSILVSPSEIKLVDQPAFQRLRNIKQLGFADFAFPGATHSRYSHSLGTMHLATRVFDRLFPIGDLPSDVRDRFRQTVRLAMLFHDIGHAPLSHTTEIVMPKVSELQLDKYIKGDGSRRATHEDYTLKLITDSPLSEHIKKYFAPLGVDTHQIAELIFDQFKGEGAFSHAGVNYAPLLRQIVTSECDADRMDYLQRDSFYCGVSYGKFDADWLIDNVVPIEQDGAMYMGIRSRAVFSFEDFLLSRYHMFASVYLHHTPIIFEKLLEKYVQDDDANFSLPSDIEAYIALDDIDIWHALRQSKSRWARRIVERKPYYLLDENQQDHETLASRLTEQGIDIIKSHSKSVLSKYFGQGAIPMYVVTNTGQIVSLESYTPLYMRYKSPAEFYRIYVMPEQRELATKVLAEFVRERYPDGAKVYK